MGGHSPVPYLTRPPRMPASRRAVRLLQILLLILPILPIVQLAKVSFEVGQNQVRRRTSPPCARTLVACWLIRRGCSVVGLLRGRSGLAERRMRIALATAVTSHAVLAGAAVALALPAWRPATSR